MSFIRHVLIGALAPLLLAACAGRGGESGSGGSAEPEYGSGIQTRSIRSAPAAEAARNESRPLSELNTPDAIAAREALARDGGRATPSKPAPPAAAPTAAAKPAASNDPHQKNDSLQKGAKVTVRGAALLHARPSAAGDASPLAAGTTVELGPQIYNAGGYWWYVTAGKDSGWLSQADLQP